MKSLQQIKDYPTGRALYADSIIEFHAARLLLLLRYCGTKERETKNYRIDGLTKFAKLDFFLRYPIFFKVVSQKLNKPADVIRKDIESKMVRFHYGPWDHRYYQILPYLESRGLITVDKTSNTYKFRLTNVGVSIVDNIQTNESFSELIHDLKEIKKVLGKMSGSSLKNLIYETFGDEVTIKKLKDEIGYE